MQFASLTFILFFLPGTLLVYHLVSRKSGLYARLVLLAASLLFCGLTDLWSLCTLLVSAAVSFLFARAILRAGPGAKRGRMLLAAGIILQAAGLIYFKYLGFLTGAIGLLLGNDFMWQSVILPLGISYSTFTQIAFLVDVWRGRISEPVRFWEYAGYLFFFPKLTQGPIASGTALFEQLSGRSAGGRVTSEGLSSGLVLFTFGLSKKLLIADVFGRAVDTVFAAYPYFSPADVVVTILSYSFQIYFDFSGYSDMAMGVARMFGYELPVNFNSPYRAQSITDFWRRWHMSLTGFLREYLYFPLGGSRKGTLRTLGNIMVVFLVSGLWHGANWTFVLWGAFHGLLQVLERTAGKLIARICAGRANPALPVIAAAVLRILRWAVTFALVSVLWLLFRCPSAEVFGGFLDILREDMPWSIRQDVLEVFRLPGIRGLLGAAVTESAEGLIGTLSMVFWMILAFVICLQPKNNETCVYRRNTFLFAVTAVLLAVCILSANDMSAFLYTNF